MIKDDIFFHLFLSKEPGTRLATVSAPLVRRTSAEQNSKYFCDTVTLKGKEHEDCVYNTLFIRTHADAEPHVPRELYLIASLSQVFLCSNAYTFFSGSSL
jgi:hypothetical protein